MITHAIPIGLGSDSVASNNAMDILSEARQATLFAATLAGRADALSAADALAMATLGGARALGLEEDIGTLEPGKAADVVAFDLDDVRAGAVHDPAVALVHSLAGRAKATLVLVDGEPRVVDGQVDGFVDSVERSRSAEFSSRIATMAARLHAWMA
jgi:5-methylthioadenosine/S-adenosylhomocysteine deaminase